MQKRDKCRANVWQMQVLCENTTSVMRMCDKCKYYATTRQVLYEYVTSVMLKRDKCHAETRKRHTNMWQMQVLSENATSVMRHQDKCHAKTQQVLKEKCARFYKEQKVFKSITSVLRCDRKLAH